MAPSIRGESEHRDADQGLMRRVVAGDETALACLYDRYGGVVYSVVQRILNDTGAAEEVLQDTFYHLWRNASRFEAARGSLSGWLLVTARNRAIDRLRRRKRADEEPIDGEPAVVGPDLESSAARNEMTSKIRAAFSGLSDDQRRALELAYFQGMTHSEIARHIGQPLGTVKTRLRAAVQSLKHVLNP